MLDPAWLGVPPGGTRIALLIAAAVIGLSGIWLHSRWSKCLPTWRGAVIPAIYLAFAVAWLVVEPSSWRGFVGHGAALLCLLVIWWAAGEERARAREAAGEAVSAEAAETAKLASAGAPATPSAANPAGTANPVPAVRSDDLHENEILTEGTTAGAR